MKKNEKVHVLIRYKGYEIKIILMEGGECLPLGLKRAVS